MNRTTAAFLVTISLAALSVGAADWPAWRGPILFGTAFARDRQDFDLRFSAGRG
jgi:hypothetical protein